jgi:hypothetical protein
MKFCVRRMYAMVLRASCTQQNDDDGHNIK